MGLYEEFHKNLIWQPADDKIVEEIQLSDYDRMGEQIRGMKQLKVKENETEGE